MSENRKLGQIEQSMELLNKEAKTWKLITISRLNQPLNLDVIRQSLDIIQSRHNRLNSRIINWRNQLYFQTQGTQRIALRVVEKLKNDQWQEVVNEEMNDNFNSKNGLLQVVLVNIVNNHQISYLITNIHHAIADGICSIQLHSEILTCYQKILAGETIYPISNLSSLPPIEYLLPQSKKGFHGKISSILFLLRLAFQKLWHRPETLIPEKYVPIIKRRSKIIHRQIKQELTQVFINRCRQENTTIHSALCSVMMFTIAKKIMKAHQQEIPLNCLSYLDLRKRLESVISKTEMGVLATSIMEFHTIKINTYFWELARQVKQKLEIDIQNGNIFNMILIARHLIDFCFIFPQQVAATVSISNVGKVNIPNIYGELELEEISFAGSHALYAGMFVLHASTFQEKMLLNFVFSEPSISQSTMESLIKNFMFCISEICSLNLDMSFSSWFQI